MANNRVYIKCEICGGGVYLGKYYPSQGWYDDHKEPNTHKLFEFLNAHIECGFNALPDPASTELLGPEYYKLVFEGKDNYSLPFKKNQS